MRFSFNLNLIFNFIRENVAIDSKFDVFDISSLFSIFFLSFSL